MLETFNFICKYLNYVLKNNKIFYQVRQKINECLISNMTCVSIVCIHICIYIPMIKCETDRERMPYFGNRIDIIDFLYFPFPIKTTRTQPNTLCVYRRCSGYSYFFHVSVHLHHTGRPTAALKTVVHIKPFLPETLYVKRNTRICINKRCALHVWCILSVHTTLCNIVTP